MSVARDNRATARFQTRGELRDKYPEEFAVLKKAAIAEVPLTEKTNSRFAKGYSKAMTRLSHAHEAEYQQMMDDYGGPKVGHRVYGKPGVELRTEIDPTDAVILYERGMNVKQIAAHDGCSQRAVLEALVPILAKRRSRAAAWFEPERRMGAREIAERLDTWQSHVENVLYAAA